MAEEAKKVEASKIVSTILKVIVGLALLVLGVLAIARWWSLLLLIIKGCVGLFLFLAGLITLAVAKD